LSCGIGYGLHCYNGNPEGFLYPLKFMIGNTFFGRSMEFFFGMLLAYLMKQEKGMKMLAKLKNPTLYGGILIIIFTVLIAFFARNNFVHGVERWEGRLIHELLLPAAIAIFFWGLISEKTQVSKILSTKVFVLLGNASFVFYLIHISYFNMKLKSYFYLPDHNFVILWICSIIIYLCIEKPLYQWCRNLITKIK
jgi:peptidoglycan/LPS O-acetylase OafA/YrhL